MPGCNPKTHCAVADAVNESREPRVADDAQCSAGRTHGRRRWIVFRLEENRFDDIHEIPPIPHAMPLRLKRCRCATYAVGKVGASSHQMTRGEKQRDNQEKADSAGDSGCTMKRFLLAILRRAKAGQSYVCAVMAGLVPVIQVLPIRRH